LTADGEVGYDFRTVSRSKPRPCRSELSTLLSITIIVACLVTSGPVPQAVAGEVRGQLVLGTLRAAPRAKPPRAAYNWELENGVKEVLPTRVSAPRELAVVLLGAAAAKAEERIEVAISGGTLLPATLVLRSGTTLRIRNDDEIGHELFAEGLDGFSAEATSPGATRSVHIVKTGHWPLRDRLAAHATAHLHVLANLVASAKLEANGSFVFADVAPGKYTLKVFRGSGEIASKEIEVADKPLALDPVMLGDAKRAP
jgi:hypothetical protein